MEVNLDGLVDLPPSHLAQANKGKTPTSGGEAGEHGGDNHANHGSGYVNRDDIGGGKDGSSGLEELNHTYEFSTKEAGDVTPAKRESGGGEGDGEDGGEGDGSNFSSKNMGDYQTSSAVFADVNNTNEIFTSMSSRLDEYAGSGGDEVVNHSDMDSYDGSLKTFSGGKRLLPFTFNFFNSIHF